MDPYLPDISPKDFTYYPLVPERWADFERLFAEHGIQNGCWCMYWRTRREDCQRGYGENNKSAFKALVESGKIPGLLAYHAGKAIAWCSIAPREDYPVLERSRTLKRVDDQPVWSIACFFVSQPYRRKGMTELLIQAVVDYAQSNGARIVESYPLRTEITKLLPYERYMGIQSTYARLGFQVVASRSKRRLVMRYIIGTGKGNENDSSMV
jgi:GNAT superfamily N-acetyltransferase